MNGWMWAEACELLDRAERLQRQSFRPATARTTKPVWEAPVDILETDRHLVIVVALPGVRPERLETTIGSGTLLVAGERPMPAEYRAGTIHRLEIPHGRFERRVELPAGHFEVEANVLVNGCLHLQLRKLG